MPECSPKTEAAVLSARPGEAEPLRIAVYTSPWSRIAKPTGVGQHIVWMTTCLAQSPDVAASMLVTRGDYRQAQMHFPQSFSRMTVRFLPGPDRWIRRALLWTSLVPIEHWSGEVDWVYSPKEFPVAARRARVAVTVHDLLPFEREVAGLSRSLLPTAGFRSRMVMRRILERATLIATVSEFTRERILELYGRQYASRCVVVGNGVSPCYFQRSQANDLETLERFGLKPLGYPISVGSLTFRKGGDLLLEMAQHIQRGHWPMQFVVTGRRHDSNLLDRLKSIKRENPAFPVHLVGYICDEDQAALLRHSAALVFPTRYEGFGIPVLEAMAAGTPVICSTAAALPEVAGSAAVYVDSGRVDEWLEPLQMLIEGRVDRDSLIAAGRKHAANQTWSRCADRLLAELRSR